MIMRRERLEAHEQAAIKFKLLLFFLTCPHGLNVICCGDMWQLDPPDGGFIGAIPADYIKRARKFMPAPSISHGQSLFWSARETGFHGVTELHQNERCDDPWLQEVQEEIRAGELSDGNYAFLHGEPTVFPGSWAKGRAQCGKSMCQMLGDVALQPNTRTEEAANYNDVVGRNECDACRAERASKELVVNGPQDKRFQQEQFRKAPAVFANNDIKYETNKRRARQFADLEGKRIIHIIAKDVPSTEALTQKPALCTEKVKWLQRHDRECGDLYGVLPLCVASG